MKLIYKDAIGFSCLILIVIIGELFLFENQSSIVSISDHSNEHNEEEITKQIQHGIDEITIEVEDSGMGITDELLYKIFNPLFTTKQQGTSLGLASVKSIVDSHGGIISATSPSTIFTIILPKIEK